MTKFKTPATALWLAAAALGAAALFCGTHAGSTLRAAPGASSSSMLPPGVTKPSQESNLAFPGPGIVTTVPVKAGDVVKANQSVIAVQDDREEKAKLDQADADVSAQKKQVEATIADRDLRKVKKERMESLYAEDLKKQVTNTEVDEARAEYKIGVISVEYQEQVTGQKEKARDLQKVKVDQKTLRSPIDGIVSKIDVHPGDGSDISKPVVQIVQIDPLWVEVDVPSGKARQLSVGQSLQVRYTDPSDERNWMPAKIIFLTPYANAGSNTRRVRLEMANPQNREAGLSVVVQLPEGVTDSR